MSITDSAAAACRRLADQTATLHLLGEDHGGVLHHTDFREAIVGFLAEDEASA